MPQLDTIRWRNLHFVGDSVKDCVDFIRNAPRPPEGLNAKNCAILQRELYDKNNCVLICKAVGDRDLQTTPCNADRIGPFYMGLTVMAKRKTTKYRSCTKAKYSAKWLRRF